MAYTVTVLETSAIQGYIFASNRLSEAVGGSHLVEHTLQDVLDAAIHSTKVTSFTDWEKGTSLQIVSATVPTVEVLYIGGGNAAFVANDKTIGVKIVARVSSRLIACAPGLILLAAHATLENTAIPIRDGIKAALEKLRDLKERGEVGVRGEGLGVSRACATTGLAASFFDKGTEQERGQWLSAAAKARRVAGVNAGRRSDYKPPDGYELTTDLEQLGGRPGDAHIAVVHCDGNNMGARFGDILKADAPDDEIVRRLRGLSRAVTAAGEAAMQRVFDLLGAALTRKERSLDDPEKGLTLLWANNRQKYFPMRPIIFGGDDVTWVCDGRIGLVLAAIYLEAFAREGFEGENFAACAGVAICRTAFPLSRAYAVALNATSNAKKKAREAKKSDKSNNSSWLDFSFIMSGIAGDVATKNQRHNDPYLVSSTKDALSNVAQWRDFANTVTALQTSLKRTQAKTLYDAVVRGETAKNDALQQLKLRLASEKKGVPAWFAEENSQLTTKLLYDALMTFDFFLPVVLSDGAADNNAE